MDHPWYRDSLSAWLDGELTPDESWWVEEHLKECTDCRKEVDELRRVRDLVRSLPEEVPASLLVTRVMHEVSHPTRHAILPQWIRQPAPALALVLLVSLAGLLTWRLSPTLPTRIPPASMDAPVAPALVQRPSRESPAIVTDLRTPSPDLSLAVGEKAGGAHPESSLTPLSMPAMEREDDAVALDLEEEAGVEVEQSLAETAPEPPAPKKDTASAIAKAVQHTPRDNPPPGAGVPRFASAPRAVLRSAPEARLMASPRPSSDRELYLDRKRYLPADQEILLRVAAGEYPQLSRVLQESACSFLESRVGDRYEVQLRLAEEDWRTLRETLNGRFTLREHTDPVMPWWELQAK